MKFSILHNKYSGLNFFNEETYLRYLISVSSNFKQKFVKKKKKKKKKGNDTSKQKPENTDQNSDPHQNVPNQLYVIFFFSFFFFCLSYCFLGVFALKWFKSV